LGFTQNGTLGGLVLVAIEQLSSQAGPGCSFNLVAHQSLEWGKNHGEA
jgi:hypothetical protein